MEKIEWFKKNSDYLKVLKVEVRIGCPRGTLDKWLKGERTLAERWQVALNKFLEDFMFGMSISESNIREVFAKSVEKAFEQDKPKFKEKKKIIEEKLTAIMPINIDRVVENKNKVSVPIDMTTVDVTTGEIKEKLVAIRPNWICERVESTYEAVESCISKSGNLYEVKRMFGNRIKYIYVTNLEDARQLVQVKDPLSVMLSIQ